MRQQPALRWRLARSALATVAAALIGGPVAADELPPAEPQDDEDMRDIMKALGEDAAAHGESGEPLPAAAAAAPTAPAGGPTGGGLTASNEMNPSISIVVDVALAYFSTDENDQRGGHDPTVNGFNLQQLELSVQAAVDTYFRLDANIVFSLFGVEIEEAYGTTLSLPLNLQVRAGQFLTRFGRLNNTHPHAWHFVDQPLLHGKFFGSEGQRGLGLELSVLLPLPWYVEVLASVSGASGGATMRSFLGNQTPRLDGPEDLLYVAAIKQFFPLSSDWSLAWGISGALGPNPTGRDNRTDIYGTDIFLKWRPVTYGSYQVVSLETEWMWRRRQVPGAVLEDFGGYAQLFWQFDQRWAAAARYEFLSPVTGGADYLDPGQERAEHRVSANLTFWPTEFSRIRAQYSAHVPLWRDEVTHAAFLALELVVGAHGAHAF